MTKPVSPVGDDSLLHSFQGCRVAVGAFLQSPTLRNCCTTCVGVIGKNNTSVQLNQINYFFV